MRSYAERGNEKKQIRNRSRDGVSLLIVWCGFDHLLHETRLQEIERGQQEIAGRVRFRHGQVFRFGLQGRAAIQFDEGAIQVADDGSQASVQDDREIIEHRCRVIQPNTQ